MLEEEIRRFRLGKRICDEFFHDYLHPENPFQPRNIHLTRLNGINPQTDFWEGLGYITGALENGFKHPMATYKLWFKEK